MCVIIDVVIKLNSQEEDIEEIKKFVIKYGKAFIIALFIVLVVAKIPSWVGAGERGVLMDFGKVRDDKILTPGLNFVIPWYNTVVMMNVQTQVFDSEAMAASKDLQNAKTKVAVNYHLSPDAVNVLYRDIGINYQTTLIAPAIQEIVKASTAKFNAEELITMRATVKDTIQAGLAERLASRGIIIEQISITNFEFGEEFSKAIEQKVTAQQLALKAENDLTRVVIEAKQKVAQAEGEKQSTILIAEGKAKEIEIIQNQLKISPGYPNYLAVRQWDGHLPQVTGGSIPLVSIQSPNTVTTPAVATP